MNYLTTDFIYNGISSEKMKIFLCRKASDSDRTEQIGANLKYSTEKTSLMDNNYITGASYDDVYKTEMMFASREHLDQYDINYINQCLIGHRNYKKLQILQGDMTSLFLNCYMENHKITTFGGYPFVFEVDVVCDSPWAYEKERTYNYDIPVGGRAIIHNNGSHWGHRVFPKLIITCNKVNGVISIKNESDNGWETNLTGINKNEIITIDNRLQTLNSSMDLLTLGRFNKHFFELVPSQNRIVVTGDISNLKIVYSNARVVA